MKETEEQESSAKKAPTVAAAKRIIKAGQAHIQATYNNTIITIADDFGNVLAWSTAGSLGFKGAKKATPYAATQIVSTLVEKIKKTGLQDIAIFVKGIGSGRESAVRALAGNFNVISITDVTPIPHNGCRPPKVRRV
ncbi:MAG: 30S ribosomal protein S11 [Candidatus Azambacteria bacterium]|nr:30S ribosomal protein S11 [Candidatus Azambacteria bacterium]